MATILIADDDATQCIHMAHMAESDGHAVLTAASARQAFDLSRERLPEVVILDIHMECPDIGIVYGNRIQQELRIPVILASVAADKDSILKAARINPSAFLAKPCGRDQLAASILIARSHVLFLSCNLKIRELTHRIKNDLVSLYGYIDCHVADCAQPDVVAEIKSQILSMSMIYDHLSLHGSGADTVAADVFLSALIKDIWIAFNGQGRARLTLDIEKILLEESMLNALGMFVNEALTNCFKYAFRGRPAELNRVKVSFRQEDGTYKLKVTDNGQGFGRDFDVRGQRGLGLTLLASIATTLRGTLRFTERPGVRLVLSMPAHRAESGSTH